MRPVIKLNLAISGVYSVGPTSIFPTRHPCLERRRRRKARDPVSKRFRDHIHSPALNGLLTEINVAYYCIRFDPDACPCVPILSRSQFHGAHLGPTLPSSKAAALNQCLMDPVVTVALLAAATAPRIGLSTVFHASQGWYSSLPSSSPKATG